jgi:hypothetical protein
MYAVDRKDKVVEITSVPQSSPGAPLPVVVSSEYQTVLGYLTHDEVNWDNPRPEDFQRTERVAIVTFKHCSIYMFGYPNDEVFKSHPLAEGGLGPYRTYEIENSSWIRQLERMNSIHRYHRPERFWERHHYVFAFHDSTFECVAKGFEVEEISGSIHSVIPMMAEKLCIRNWLWKKQF